VGRFPEVMNAPFVGAVALLVLNDHWLKGSGLLSGAITGKISDFAGLFFFPLLLVAVGRLALMRDGRRRPHPCTLVAAVLMTGLPFVITKTTAVGADTYRAALGLLWGNRVRFCADPTDLVALAVLPLTFLYGRRFSRLGDPSTGARFPAASASTGIRPRSTTRRPTCS